MISENIKWVFLAVLEAQNHGFSERNEFRMSKMAIFDGVGALNFQFGKFVYFFRAEIFAKFKSIASENVKIGSKKCNFDFS